MNHHDVAHPFDPATADPTVVDPDRPWRRVTAFAVAALAFTDTVQAASRRSITHVGSLSFHLGGSTTRLFRYVLLLAALTLGGAARGLLRGKRVAWGLALGACAASVVGHHLVKADLAGVGMAAAVGAMLLMGAPRFPARPDPALARQGVLWILAGSFGTYTYGVAGLYLMDGQFRHHTEFAESLGQAARLLFLLPTSTIDPITRHGTWFIDSVRVLTGVVVVVGIARLLHSVVLGSAQHDREMGRVHELLERHATTSLAYFHQLDDKHHLFSEDGQAFIGYKVVGSVAVALGEPIGEPGACRQVTQLFLQRCLLNGWLPVFHQVTPAGLPGLGALGMKALKVGEEAVIDVQSFSLTGSHFKSVRSKTAKLEREGWTVRELAQPIEAATMTRLRVISDAWLDDGGHRERTFTLGQFDEGYLRSTTVLVAVDPDGTIQAFANLLPSFRSDDGNFDLMRRHPDAHNSVMDLLFVKMIERFRERGCQGMNLGLAPFSNITGDSLPDRALRVLYERGARAFNFSGLRTYKDKWRPRWEPRYLVYRSDTELPQIAVATSRAAELPHADSGRLETLTGRVGVAARALVTMGRRLPFTLAVTTVLVTLQVVTEIDTDSYAWLRSHLTYDWHDLARSHQFHRLLTAILIQDGRGIRLGILVLVPMLAAAELVLRSRRTVLVFFLGDLCSSIPVLIGLRLAAWLGSSTAMLNVATRDGGTSSAMFATITAAALTLPHRRLRQACAGSLAVFLGGSLLWYHRLFDAQHLAAALVGASCWWAFRRMDLERRGRERPEG